MIVLRADIWAFGQKPEGDANCVAALLIANDGKGTHDRGNYDVWEIRDPDGDPHVAHQTSDPVLTIKGFPRHGDQRHVCSLMALVLDLYARGETQALCWEMDR